MNKVTLRAHIFDIYNPQFSDTTNSTGCNNIKSIILTIISSKQVKKIYNIIKAYGHNYTFSISKAPEIHHKALNLKVHLPQCKYPLLSTIFDTNLLYKPLKSWVNCAYNVILQPRKFIREDNATPHMWYTMTAIESL